MMPCPMPKRQGQHRILHWQTAHRFGAADIGYSAGLSCLYCHQTWTTFERCAEVKPPRPTHEGAPS